jgi:hypothetical protein
MEVTAGVAALGFWFFLAALVVAGIWSEARKRESKQETLRRVVESGQQLDIALIDRMLVGSSRNKRPDRELKIAGIITLAVAAGMPVLGWFMSKFNEKIFTVMLGVAMLILFVSVGLFIAGKVSQRWHQEDQEK